MNHEAPYVGRDRQIDVESLLADFDAVLLSGKPRLTCLVSPTGWGKTRIIQAFYERLSLSRQGQPPYWPHRIVSDLFTEPLSIRKKVYPTNFCIPEGARLEYMWWGISCVEGPGGKRLRSIAEASPQLTHHIGPILTRIALRKKGARTATDVAASLLSALPIPDPIGLALSIRDIGKSLAEMVRVSRDARSLAHHRNIMTSDNVDPNDERAVSELVTNLRKTLLPDIPTVIVVDDAHWADPALVLFIDRIMQNDGPFLVIATAWPEKLAEQHAAEPDSPPDRCSTFGGWLTVSCRQNRSSIAIRELTRLSAFDLQRIVHTWAPSTDSIVVNALIEQADGNPLLLRSLMSLPVVMRATVEGSIAIDPSAVKRLPSAYLAQLQAKWQGLPSPVQLTLAAAAILGRRFSTDLVDHCLASVDLVGDIAAAVNSFWLRVDADGVGTFAEQSLHDVATESCRDVLNEGEALQMLVVAVDFVRSAKMQTNWPDLPVGMRRSLLWTQIQALSKSAEACRAPVDEEIGSTLQLANIEESAANYREALVLLRNVYNRLGASRVRVSQLGYELEERLFTVADYLGDFDFAYRLALDMIAAYTSNRIDRGERFILATRLAAVAEHHLGLCGVAARRMEESIRLLETLGRHEIERARAMMVRSASLYELGDQVASAALRQESIEIFERSGPRFRQEARFAKVYLALNLEKLRRPAAAKKLLLNSFAEFQMELGPKHPTTLEIAISLGRLSSEYGRLDRSRLVLESAHSLLSYLVGRNNPLTLKAERDLAVVEHLSGEHEVALQRQHRVRTGFLELLGPHHFDTVAALIHLSEGYLFSGRYDLAADYMDEALITRRADQDFIEGDEALLYALCNLGDQVKIRKVWSHLDTIALTVSNDASCVASLLMTSIGGRLDNAHVDVLVAALETPLQPIDASPIRTRPLRLIMIARESMNSLLAAAATRLTQAIVRRSTVLPFEDEALDSLGLAEPQ